MQLVLTFCGGSGRHGDPLTVHGVLHVTDAPPEVDPDDVYVATNRIEGIDADLDALPTQWQRNLRRAIDAEHNCLPSMSVGDTIELVSDAGRHLGGWRCEVAGWTPIPPAYLAQIA